MGPPFAELFVRLHEERVFRWRCFGESIANIDAETNKVECGDKSPHESMCRLLDACGIGLSDGNDFTMAGASVACSSGFGYIFDGDWIDLVEV